MPSHISPEEALVPSLENKGGKSYLVLTWAWFSSWSPSERILGPHGSLDYILRTMSLNCWELGLCEHKSRWLSFGPERIGPRWTNCDKKMKRRMKRQCWGPDFAEWLPSVPPATTWQRPGPLLPWLRKKKWLAWSHAVSEWVQEQKDWPNTLTCWKDFQLPSQAC